MRGFLSTPGVANGIWGGRRKAVRPEGGQVLPYADGVVGEAVFQGQAISAVTTASLIEGMADTGTGLRGTLSGYGTAGHAVIGIREESRVRGVPKGIVWPSEVARTAEDVENAIQAIPFV